MERKGRGKLGKGAGKLPGRQRRCYCCRAPNHPAAAVDATPLSRAKTSGMRVFHSSTPRADSRPGLAVAGSRRVAGAALRRRRGTRGLVAGGRVQLFVAVAGAPRRWRGRRLVAGGRRIWTLRGGVGIWTPRAGGGCVRTLRVGGVGSRSKENGMVVSWAGPYPNWAETYPFVSFRPK